MKMVGTASIGTLQINRGYPALVCCELGAYPQEHVIYSFSRLWFCFEFLSTTAESG